MGTGDVFYISFIFILAWIIGVIVLLLILIKKYTFGHWTAENPNPYALESFGLPPGVMRGILAMSLLIIVLLLELINLQMPIMNKNGELLAVNGSLFLPEERYKELMVAFQMMLAFYFGSKVMHHIAQVDERKSDKIVGAIEAEQSRESCMEKKDEFEEEGAVG